MERSAGEIQRGKTPPPNATSLTSFPHTVRVYFQRYVAASSSNTTLRNAWYTRMHDTMCERVPTAAPVATFGSIVGSP